MSVDREDVEYRAWLDGVFETVRSILGGEAEKGGSLRKYGDAEFGYHMATAMGEVNSQSCWAKSLSFSGRFSISNGAHTRLERSARISSLRTKFSAKIETSSSGIDSALEFSCRVGHSRRKGKRGFVDVNKARSGHNVALHEICQRFLANACRRKHICVRFIDLI